jgi:hypothetical protein
VHDSPGHFIDINQEKRLLQEKESWSFADYAKVRIFALCFS